MSEQSLLISRFFLVLDQLADPKDVSSQSAEFEAPKHF